MGRAGCLPWSWSMERASAGGSTEPVESQKATKGVSPVCEPPIEREGTPVSSRKIAILGASELAIRTSLLKRLASQTERELPATMLSLCHPVRPFYNGKPKAQNGTVSHEKGSYSVGSAVAEGLEFKTSLRCTMCSHKARPHMNPVLCSV
ncbi:hypothetical protein U0070_014260 [Myodes glareolus]|uniref:Uncharacterized protein n=1 Tax=Myodes glareolus TaxID=447135 RepID=A0AAW0I1Z6_MYOGA